METRTKCDVIPVWLFRELDAGAKHNVQVERERLSKQRNEKIDNLKEAKEKMAWEMVKGKTIVECFYFDDYNILRLNKDIQNKIEKKFSKMKKDVEDECTRKMSEIEQKYQEWKHKLLTGKIPRSRVKEFEI